MWGRCFDRRLFAPSFSCLWMFSQHMEWLCPSWGHREKPRGLQRSQSEAMRSGSHWMNHRWCRTILGLLWHEPVSLCCLSRHSIDFLLPTTQSTLNGTPRAKLTREVLTCCSLLGLSSFSLSESEYLQTLRNSRVLRSILFVQPDS